MARVGSPSTVRRVRPDLDHNFAPSVYRILLDPGAPGRPQGRGDAAPAARRCPDRGLAAPRRLDLALTVTAGIAGLAVGSFLNVAIVRLPAGESVVSPRSRCPRCWEPLRWYHNVPLVSWIVLHGRCAFCGNPIGWRYPFVEITTAAIWAANAAAYGATVETARAIVLLTLLLTVAVTDAREYVIPDELSLGGAAAGLLLALAPGPPSLVAALVGAATGAGVLWAVAIVFGWALGREAMGGGDIKLMAMIGAFLGWKGALLTIFLGAVVGTLIFVPIALRHRVTHEEEKLVPFGVFLAVGAAIAFYLGEAILDWYFWWAV